MSRWRRGDFCRVVGEGTDIFRVRDVREGDWQSADLDNLTGSPTNHGHEALSKLTRVTPREALKVAKVHRAIAGALDPKGVTGLEQVIADLQAKLAAADAAAATLADEVNTAEDRTRASIAAHLEREAARFDHAARGVSGEASYSTAVGYVHMRLTTQASLCRTLASQIARGDDRNGSAQ